MDVKLHDCFLAVDDHDKAIAFYRDALGFEVRNDVSAYGMRWVSVGPPSQPDVNIVLEPPAADPGISPSDREAISDLLAKGLLRGLNFSTPDLDGTFERVQATGARGRSRWTIGGRDTASAIREARSDHRTWLNRRS
jgi:catechol 2,3-dioxygenase-like lactoylglutathione lyase family enzyme